MYNSGSLRDRSIKIKVWGLKAWISAIFLIFSHGRRHDIKFLKNSVPPLLKRGGKEFFRMKNIEN
jgi:hypothetical protein